MKAIRCREWGAPDVLRLEEAESPRLQRHQVRIRVRAAGLNFADSLMVGGTYQVKPPFPFTPGLEAAGEIVETGSSVDGFQAGQRVLAVLRNGGGYAEEIVLDAAAVMPIPDAMDFVTAAAFPVAYGTSHFALTHRGHLRPGETLLVLGAAGGGWADGGRDRQGNGCARHRRGWRRRKTGSGERAGGRRADRLSRGKHPRPGARADRRQRRRCRLRPGRR